MRHNEDRHAARRGFSVALAFGGLWLGLAGCAGTTAGNDEAQPAAAAAQQVPFANPGSYPNLNVVPTPAATQLTEAEQAQSTTLLQSIREDQAQTSRTMRPRDDTAELRRIGRTHAEETLGIIEREGRGTAE